jgi:hypothetical protein
MFKRSALLLLFFIATPALAQPKPSLVFPAACTLGQNCWSVQYVDVEATEEAPDYTCAAKTTDDHKGTDFGLRSMAELNAGIDVIAAASGTVSRVRDGETDNIKTQEELNTISAAQKECGNGVLIDHAAGGYPGWQTMYCHLKQNSITVKAGDIVVAGQKIAQIGRSGMAEFPQLHFGVIQDNKVIDPFTGAGPEEGCGKSPAPLWKTNIAYEPLTFFDSGFAASATPDFAGIEQGIATPQTIPASTNSFVFWGAFYGIQTGDLVDIRITAPNGEVIAQRSVAQEKSRARQYYYTGRKFAPDQILKPGTYTGRITLRRKGLEDVTRTQTILVR